MDDPEYIEQNIELASLSPKKLLAGPAPRLIDGQKLDIIGFETAQHLLCKRTSAVGRFQEL